MNKGKIGLSVLAGYFYLIARDIFRVFGISLGSLGARLINCILIPCGVSFALVQIFIARGAPHCTITSFIFFSTLYIFWTGLFNACTAVNGTRDSGEWTYWVLGARRSVWGYVTALFLNRMLWTFIAVVLFFAVTLLSFAVYPENWLFAVVGPYIAPYVTNGNDISVITYPAIVALFTGTESLGLGEGVRSLSGSGMLPFMTYFALGLFGAGLSGVVWGMCSSVLFKKTANSLCFAVFITMLVTIFSLPAMQPTNSDEMRYEKGEDFYCEEALDAKTGGYRFTAAYRSEREQATRRRNTATFFPVLYGIASIGEYGRYNQVPWLRAAWQTLCEPVYYEDGKRPTRGQISNRSLALFQLASYLLPQRYFFNIAHTPVPRLGYLSRGEASDSFCGVPPPDENELARPGVDKNNPCRRNRRAEQCWCVFCLNLIGDAGTRRFRLPLNTEGLSPNEGRAVKEAENHTWLDRGDPPSLNSIAHAEYFASDYDILKALWSRTARYETAALLLSLLIVPGGAFVLLISSYSIKQLR